MRELIERLTGSFRNYFRVEPQGIFQAPGRVNLIGEHTDYNQGFVLPCAIDRRTYMAVRTRSDGRLRVVSANMDGRASEWLASNPPPADRDNPWANYLRGVHAQFLKQGRAVSGMDILTLGDIPQGAGLSSSASFCVVFATAVNHVMGAGMSALQIALLCQAAENEFVGCNCGIMDQLISAAGRERHALLIDCRSLEYQPVALPDDMDAVIINSKVARGLIGSGYNDRRRQCEAAAAALKAGSLRDVGMAELLADETVMDPVCFRRARHVITENARTKAAALALAGGDYAALGGLMAASHISMRDDFAITTPEIDFLVSTVGCVLQNRGGVRMTGGGFGGCVVALAPKQLSGRIIDAVNAHYPSETGLKAEIYLCNAGEGAGRLL
ncbi:MAG TPA: galactokinase [Gammaproteobacteria bacterium]|nr:galactokinase [Gammaproteobacteria bacterium]